MPITRSPSTRWTASVTIPAGLVKFTSHASGAWSRIVSASRIICGIVRSAKQIPPGPVVSCPRTSSASGTDSSITRPSSRPTRIAQNTKSAPSTASVEVGGDGERQVPAALVGEALEHGAHALEAARVDVVEHDLVERERLAAAQQSAVHERHPEPSATDDRELHRGRRAAGSTPGSYGDTPSHGVASSPSDGRCAPGWQLSHAAK